MQDYKSIEELPITLNANQVAKTLGISRAGAYDLLNSKGFPTIRIGKRLVVPKEHFIKWMDQQSGGIA